MVPDPPNATIAALFDELADLYELDGAVVHRVLAYRNAAKSVREAPTSVAAMTREGRVTELPGIGRTLEEKIHALLETGHIPAVEEIRGRGLLWGVQLRTAEIAKKWMLAAWSRGVLLLAGGPEGRVAQLVPPLTIREEQLAGAVGILEEVTSP